MRPIILNICNHLHREIYLRLKYTPGAPSLRFLQAWGFSKFYPSFPVTQNLNPHPLKNHEGWGTRRNLSRAGVVHLRNMPHPATIRQESSRLDDFPSSNLYSLREFRFRET
jgi:hypothetical protein